MKTLKIARPLGGVLLFAGLFPAAALAQSVEIVFVVDESGSMAGEHQFLQTFAPSLDGFLSSAGIRSRQFGLTGFAASSVLPRTFDINGSLFGSASDFVTAAQNLVTSGGFEDGYQGIDFALDTYTFTADTRIIILVTDEDRDVGDSSITLTSLLADVSAADVTLSGILNQGITDQAGTQAIGASATQTFIDADGDGSFELSTAPIFIEYFDAGTTLDDYTLPIIGQPDGCVADLNLLRSGGTNATAFAEALTVCVVRQSLGDSGPVVAAPNPTPLLPVISLLPTGSSFAHGRVISNGVNVVDAENFNIYAIVKGVSAEQDPIADQPGIDTTGGIISLGANAGVGDTVQLGAILSYLTAESEAQTSASTVESTGFVITGTADLNAGRFGAGLSLSAGSIDYESVRLLENGRVEGSTSGMLYIADAEVRYDFGMNDLEFEALAGTRISHFTVDAFEETGVAPLGYEDQTYDMVDVRAGMNIGSSLRSNAAFGDAFARVFIGAEYRVVDSNDGISVSIFDESIGVSEVESASPLIGRVAPTLGWQSASGKLSASIGYEGAFGSDSTFHGAFLRAGLRF